MVHDKENFFQCIMYNHTTPEEDSLKTHMKGVHDKEQDCQCNMCLFSTDSINGLDTHITTVHELKCSLCDYITDKNGNLNTHIKEVHNNMKVFQCKECDYTGCKRNQTHRHIKIVHNHDIIKTWIIKNISTIPSFFWRSKFVDALPRNYKQRKRICQEVTDIEHFRFCQRKDFHLCQLIEEICICRYCNNQLEHFHKYFGCFPFKQYPELSIFE